MAPRTEPPSAGRKRKRFLSDGNDVVALAASIAATQEEKTHEKIKHHQETLAGQASDGPRGKNKSASRARLKEKKAALAAKKAQTKKDKMKSKKQRQTADHVPKAPVAAGIADGTTKSVSKRCKTVPHITRAAIRASVCLDAYSSYVDAICFDAYFFPPSSSPSIHGDISAMKSRHTTRAPRIRVSMRSSSSSSSHSCASVSYMDSLSPDGYVQQLTQTRDALRRFPTVQRSRSPSPAAVEVQGRKKGKVAPPSLQDAVRAIIRAAKGNPAYGGWSQLAVLLRTSTSIGKHTYIIKRSHLVMPDPPANGWPKMFKTQDEFEAWLSRREAERKIKAWQLTVNATQTGSEPKSDRRISNFDVSSYFPPSFPTSQVITSTPNREGKARRKPSPIPPVASALSLPSAPLLPPSPPACIQSGPVTVAPAASSSSIPGLRSSPTPSRDKRRRRATPEPARKRMRADPIPSYTETDERLYGLPASAEYAHGDSHLPARRSPPPLPTLTDLLSATRKSSPAKVSPAKTTTNFAFAPVPPGSAGHHTTDVDQRRNSPPQPFPVIARAPSPDPFLAQSAITIASSTEDHTGRCSAPGTKQSSGLDFQFGQGQPAVASFDGAFDPPFTSTAPDQLGTGPSSSFDDLVLGEPYQYNSQLEFEDKLEAASRRIEEDVDPLAWLNDDTFGSDQVDGVGSVSHGGLRRRLIMSAFALVCLAALGAAFRIVHRVIRGRRFLCHVPGPVSRCPLLGNLPELLRCPAAELEFEWQRRYGGVVKYHGAFGEQLLMISDPVAVQYVAQTSGYAFVRPSDRKEVSRQLLGRGILTVEGHDHRRHRRIMAPGLSSGEVNSYVSVFINKAARTWPCAMSHIGRLARRSTLLVKVCICSSLVPPRPLTSRSAAFDYQFNALDNDENEMAKVYHNLLSKTRRNPSNYEIFMNEAIGHLPERLVRFCNDMVPNKRRSRARRCKAVAEPIARKLISNKVSALQAGEGGTDVMSRLVKSNASVNAEDRLDEEELLAQLLTMILSGHETTANTLSWALYELCRHRDVQTRLRQELRTYRVKWGPSGLTSAAFDKMPYLAAVVKETLRFHSPVYNTARTAAREEIIPLGEPIIDKQGTPIHKILVSKGQKIVISIASYNRNAQMFGPNPDQFSPERWLNPKYVDRRTNIGMYSNLLTFGGGHRGCAGWRFAVLELSAFLFELVSRFDFALSPTLRVHRGAAAVMVPMIEGELEKGTQLPLLVRHAAFAD
ncbi:cytochrome P450 [Schizophyllum fasciatum]